MKDGFVFPQDHHRESGVPGAVPWLVREGGLTKRELFAAMIYAAMISNLQNATEAAALERTGAVGTVALADALLAELEKPDASRKG